VANNYTTADHLQDMFPTLSFEGPTPSGTQFEVILNDLITRASRMIDTYVGRKPGAFKADTDVTYYFDAPRGEGYLYYEQYGERLAGTYGQGHQLWIGELAAAPTSIAISQDGQLTYTALASTDYHLWPYNALDEGHPYMRIDLDVLNGVQSTWYGMTKGVRVIGRFGYSTTPPADVEQAVLIQAARWWKRAQSGWQDKVSIIDNAIALTHLNKLDADVSELIRHYRRQAI
jgi:hypothetical protein